MTIVQRNQRGVLHVTLGMRTMNFAETVIRYDKIRVKPIHGSIGLKLCTPKPSSYALEHVLHRVAPFQHLARECWRICCTFKAETYSEEQVERCADRVTKWWFQVRCFEILEVVCMRAKGVILSEIVLGIQWLSKRIVLNLFRFPETILRFGEPGSLEYVDSNLPPSLF